MRFELIAVGVILVVVGVTRHLMPNSLPRMGFQLVRLPGFAIAVLGVMLVILGVWM